MAFHPWSLRTLLRLRCPACGADTFRAGWYKTAARCCGCGQIFEREAGFYAGSIYPMYAGAAAIGGIFFGVAHALGLPLAWVWVVAAAGVIGVSPWLFWYARLAFLHTDHRFFGEA